MKRTGEERMVPKHCATKFIRERERGERRNLFGKKGRGGKILGRERLASGLPGLGNCRNWANPGPSKRAWVAIKKIDTNFKDVDH